MSTCFEKVFFVQTEREIRLWVQCHAVSHIVIDPDVRKALGEILFIVDESKWRCRYPNENDVAGVIEVFQRNKEMLRKEEAMRMKLSEKAKALQADYDDFQRKLQNNVYATRERAEEEQARILKQKDALEKLEQRLIGELSAESQKNNITLHDSIDSFLKAYNAEKKYDLILSRVGDNLLFANEALDITEEVINGLNARYTPKTEE